MCLVCTRRSAGAGAPAHPAAAGARSSAANRSDGRYRNPHRGLRHRCHRPVRVRGIPQSTAAGVRGQLRRSGCRVRWLVCAGRAARRHRVDRRSGRGALHRCHRRRHAAAGGSHAAWRLTAARRCGADQPPQLPDGDHHQGPAAAEFPPGAGRGGARRLADRVGVQAQRRLPGRPADTDQRILRPGSHARFANWVGLHRGRQLHPWGAGGAVSGHPGNRSPTGPAGRAGRAAPTAVGTSRRLRSGPTSSAR